jgi:hypothetical protein
MAFPVHRLERDTKKSYYKKKMEWRAVTALPPMPLKYPAYNFLYFMECALITTSASRYCKPVAVWGC